jgi:hypothetical protein
MTEKQYKYTAEIKQPQTVSDVKLNPNGGFLSEREIRAVKKDAYGLTLIETELLVIAKEPETGGGGGYPLRRLRPTMLMLKTSFPILTNLTTRG